MTTPLLCREGARQRALDLLAKRDSLLLLREGEEGAMASVPAVAAALGGELRAEEERASVLLATLRGELQQEEEHKRHLHSCVEAHVRRERGGVDTCTLQT